MRLKNRVALVTGGAQGIGRAIAVRLAQEGADIVIAGRVEDERTEDTEKLVRAEGRRAFTVAGDIQKIEVCRKLVSAGVEQLGRIDFLVNNAGIEKSSHFWETSEDEYDQTMGVNLKGAFFTTQAFVQHLRDTKRPGKIVNVSSVHDELPFPCFTDYCVSKGGMKMMMRNLAIELAPLGITVNNISPGAIETPMNNDLLEDPEQMKRLLNNIPLGRLGKPEDVAGVAAFLLSADADYMTGSTVYIDGGLMWNYQEN